MRLFIMNIEHRRSGRTQWMVSGLIELPPRIVHRQRAAGCKKKTNSLRGQQVVMILTLEHVYLHTKRPEKDTLQALSYVDTYSHRIRSLLQVNWWNIPLDFIFAVLILILPHLLQNVYLIWQPRCFVLERCSIPHITRSHQWPFHHEINI